MLGWVSKQKYNEIDSRMNSASKDNQQLLLKVQNLEFELSNIKHQHEQLLQSEKIWQEVQTMLKPIVEKNLGEHASIKDKLGVLIGHFTSHQNHQKTSSTELTHQRSLTSSQQQELDQVRDKIVRLSKTSSPIPSKISQQLQLSHEQQQQTADLFHLTDLAKQQNEQILQEARIAQEIAKVQRQLLQKGEDAMNQSLQSMQAIASSSNQVTEIVTLIDSIAFQTNLLALNAAVEAARAGDHGRGFAVVASEVRLLSQKSADAAHTIKNLIDQSVSQSSKGMEDINVLSSSVDAIKNQAAKMRETVLSIENVATKQDREGNQMDAIIQKLHATSQDSLQAVASLNESVQMWISEFER